MVPAPLALPLTWSLPSSRNQADLEYSTEHQRLTKELEEVDEQERLVDALISSVSSALKLAKEDPADRPYG